MPQPIRVVALPVAAFAAIALAACAPRTPAAAAPAPVSSVVPGEAPFNWHLLDQSEGYPGISVLRAERELLKGKEPKRVVLVAVIDNGVDTSHASLRAHLWANPKEIPGN